MIILVSRFLIRRGFNGITLWPFVVLRKREMKEDAVMLNHEKIHLRQQIEMLVLPFYLWYVIEFLIRWFQYKNRHTAYRNISFEREAYSFQNNFKYIKRRQFWAFVRFIKKG